MPGNRDPTSSARQAALDFFSAFGLSGLEEDEELEELLPESDEEDDEDDELSEEDEELASAFFFSACLSAIFASCLSAPSEADFSSSRLRFFVP